MGIHGLPMVVMNFIDGLSLLALVLIGVPMVSLFGVVPIAWIWTNHRRKMEQLHLNREGLLTQDILAEFKAVRAEIQALRDTTMQYDLSFDTTLHQMERRLSSLERQAIAQRSESVDQNVTFGGR